MTIRLAQGSGSVQFFITAIRTAVRFNPPATLLIVVIIASTMALGFVYLKITPPTYAAHARLMIDSSKVRALQQQTMPGTYFPMIDIAEINTQVELLQSDSIGLTVVKDQHLTENTAFVGGTGEGPLRAAFAKIKGLFGFGTAKVSDTRSESN